MAGSNICRLCRTSCRSTFRLHDANGQPNKLYNICITFFSPTLLQAGTDYEYPIAVICQECFQHISDFYNFQQTILDLQEDLVKDTVQIVSKEVNEENPYYVDKQPEKPVNITNAEFESNSNKKGSSDVILLDDESSDDHTELSIDQKPSCSHQLEHTSPANQVVTNLRKSDESISRDDENGEVVKIKEEICDIRDDEIKLAQEGKLIKHEELLSDISEHEFITDEEFISDDEHSLLQTIDNECSSKNSDDSNQFLLIGNTDNSLGDASSARPKNKRDTNASAMIDSIIAKWKPQLVCNICSEKFSLYSQIKLHHRINHAESKFYISCCGRKMRQRFRIEEHALLHTNPKAFQCKDCDKCFSARYILETHRKCHFPGGPTYKHICTICGKGFRDPSTLRDHYAMHTGKALPHCSYCTKTFKYHSNLSRHMEKIHPEKVDNSNYKPESKCSICAKTFSSHSGLYKHKKREHPQNYEQKRKRNPIRENIYTQEKTD